MKGHYGRAGVEGSTSAHAWRALEDFAGRGHPQEAAAWRLQSDEGKSSWYIVGI